MLYLITVINEKSGKTTELEEISDHKQKEIKDLDDWTAVLGISPSMLTTPMNAKELGGSIRARHFAMVCVV